MKLATSTLASHLDAEHYGIEVDVSGFSTIAAEVEPGDLFVALQGAKHHGGEFLKQAKSRGAVAVLSDKKLETDLALLVHPNPREILGQVSQRILGPVQLELFAVTGTNGKTSTITFLQELLCKLGSRCALSSSATMLFDGREYPHSLTTPELSSLRKFLLTVEVSGGNSAAIEVSAQALIRQRVDGLQFEVAGFTNLTRDHLDDFGDMQTYFLAKQQLFTQQRSKKAAVFVSDDYSQRLVDSMPIDVITVGKGQQVDYSFDSGFLKLSGAFELEVDFPFGELMARNYSLALTMLFMHGYSQSELQAVANEPGQVPGRLELVANQPDVYIDYAHTPDGVSSAVSDLKARYEMVTLVVAASGNRDQGKRFEMGQAAAMADLIIVTDQHPRDEDPAFIRAQVIEGLAASRREFVELADPKAAIEWAIRNSPRHAAVLWCGPGHLEYREISGVKVPFDAKAVAREAAKNA